MRFFLRRLVGIWSYLAASAAAILIAGTVSWAANIPLLSGPACQEASQEVACLNSLITSINFNSAGLYGSQLGPTSSIATTVQTNWVNTLVAQGQLTSAGQGLRITCSGITASNTDAKNAFLTVGTVTVSPGNFSTSAANWTLEMLFTAATNPVTANYVYAGKTLVGLNTANATTQLFNGNDTAAADNIAVGNLPVKCGYVQGTQAVDMTLETFTIEQVK